ncbi:hypothetical protein Agabi119p4_6908 [Agaricus bisporus var. burnettii]|uniref:Uncharacterized protein n=1 Tax=Agaricus bisporus var. burnettii TaxID=192524 RepID=A0A8H7F0D7_AGABI|nr:hypothetical protein Agabi119p4_8513 [Agaricus bisporus var. burnettii]KAF7770934.1 hypothetical protein Agabi119p4_6908 [Agaricus bisporus var. burnettii]
MYPPYPPQRQSPESIPEYDSQFDYVGGNRDFPDFPNQQGLIQWQHDNPHLRHPYHLSPRLELIHFRNLQPNDLADIYKQLTGAGEGSSAVENPAQDERTTSTEEPDQLAPRLDDAENGLTKDIKDMIEVKGINEVVDENDKCGKNENKRTTRDIGVMTDRITKKAKVNN